MSRTDTMTSKHTPRAPGRTSTARWALATAALCLFVSHPAMAQDGSADEATVGAVREVKLGRGRPRLITAARPSDRAQVVVQFQTGAFDDGLVWGLSRVAQHTMLFANRAGSGKQLITDVFDAGGSLQVSVGVRRTRFVLEAPKAAMPKLSKRLFKLLFDFTPNPSRFNYVLQLSKNERVESGGATDAESFIAGSTIFMEGGEGGNEYNNPLYPDTDGLRRLRMFSVTEHIDAKMRPANATVVATGGVSVSKLKRDLKRYSGGKRRGLQRPDLTAALPMSVQRAARRDIIMQAQLVDLSTPEKQAAAKLLTSMLQEQSMWQLRKKGMTYSTSAELVSREWMDYIIVTVPISESSKAPVRPALSDINRSFASKWFKPELLERHREHVVRAMLAADRDPAQLGAMLADTAPTKAHHSAATLSAVRAMSADRFQALVKPWLDASASITVAFGPELQSRTRTGTR